MSQAFATVGVSDGGFGESESNGDTKSEVTEVAELSTGPIDSKHKQTRPSYNTIRYTLPTKFPPSNIVIPRNYPGKTS